MFILESENESLPDGFIKNTIQFSHWAVTKIKDKMLIFTLAQCKCVCYAAVIFQVYLLQFRVLCRTDVLRPILSDSNQLYFACLVLLYVSSVHDIKAKNNQCHQFNRLQDNKWWNQNWQRATLWKSMYWEKLKILPYFRKWYGIKRIWIELSIQQH